MQVLRSLLLLLGALVGCGGLTSGSSPGAEAGAPEAAGPDSASSDDGGGLGWTACTAPDGVTVCGSDVCGNPSTCDCYPPNAGLQLCTTSPGYSMRACNAVCGQDELCISIGGPQDPHPLWTCEPWNAGQLFAANGETARVKYADFAAWVGATITEQTSCPSTSSALTLCGGPCGICPGEMECTGRSPLHPFGWCTTRPLSVCAPGTPCSEGGFACFTYTVQPEAQDFANQNSYCLPSAQCDALAAQLPGGGACTH